MNTYYDELISNLFGFMFGAFLFFIIIIFIISLLMIIARWKIFTKAKEDGWKSIIPIYADWTLCKIVGLSPYWIIELFAVSFISGFVSEIAGNDSVMSDLFNIVVAANSFYYYIILNVSLAKSYGKQSVFSVVLFLLPVIGYPILGFGKAEYVGQMPCNDPVMKFIRDTLNIKDDGTGRNNSTNTNNSVQSTIVTPQNNNFQVNQSSQINQSNNFSTNINSVANEQINSTNLMDQQRKFCPNCGNQLNDDDIYCQKCGTKVN